MYSFKYKQIGRKVAYYRQLRKMTQGELAKKVNISVSSLGKIERGRYNNNVSLSMLMAIADGLGVELSMLVTFDKRENALEWELLENEQENQ